MSTVNTFLTILKKRKQIIKDPGVLFKIIKSKKDLQKLKVFSCLVRDPRYGMGDMDLGRILMFIAGIPAEYIPTVGRWDDLFHIGILNNFISQSNPYWEYLKEELNELEVNSLCKKWMPRERKNKNLPHVRQFVKYLNMTSKEYRQRVSCNDTTEAILSRKEKVNIKDLTQGAYDKYKYRLEVSEEEYHNSKEYTYRKNKLKLKHHLASKKKDSNWLNKAIQLYSDCIYHNYNIDIKVL